MNRILAGLLLLTVSFAVPALAADDDDDKGGVRYEKGLVAESADGAFSVLMGSRVQFRFTHQDPEMGESNGSFNVRRAKIFFKGRIYEDWKFKVQAVWSSDQSDDSAEGTELEDANFQFTRWSWAQPWLGQGKVFFGRQQLTSSGSQQFVDRSIVDKAFHPARSQGVALVGHDPNKRFEYNLGVYDDFKGQNVNSNMDDNYLTVARVVWTPFGAYKPEESSLDYPDGPKLAVGAKALCDTVDLGGGDEEEIETIGLEFAFKIRGFNTVGEIYERSVDETGLPSMDTSGYYLQLGYLFPNRKFEVAGRHAEISPDVAGSSEDRTETGVAVSWYFQKHRYKVQADYRMLEFDEDPLMDTDEIRAQVQFIF